MSLRHDDHSSSPSLAAWIERPTRGFILQRGLRRTEGSTLVSRAHSVSRASSPLLFGLAPRGVCLASVIAAGAVGSYPTLSPLPALRSMGRCPEGFSCRAITGMRSAGGIFSVALSVTRSFLAASPGVTRRVALLCHRKVVSGLSSRQPFLHLPVNARPASDRPAHPPFSLYRDFVEGRSARRTSRVERWRIPTEAQRQTEVKFL